MVEESRLIISIDARNAERNARELNRELNNMTTNGIRAESQMNGMGSAFRSLAGYMAGVVTIGTAISKMDTYTGLQNRLKLVTDSQSELNQAMSDTFAIAQKTASSWDSAAMVYQRFADNADRLNITMKQTASLTETVSKAISISGGTAASADAALVQFGQALASGVLRGEEFNSIAEQAPGLLKAIANGLDTNVGSLRAMAAEGKITADVLVKSLTKAQPYIDDLFNKTDFTISQSFTKLSNEVTKFIGEAGKANGAASGLSDAINVLANNLSTIANIAVIGGVALLTKTILSQTVAIYGSVTASIARRGAALAELQATAQVTTAEVSRTAALMLREKAQLADARAQALRLTGMQRLIYVESTVLPLERANTAAISAHTAATTADTAAQNANNTARSRGAMLLGAVGGPIGAITIGVTALAASYMLLKDSSNGSNDSLSNQIEIVSELAQKYRELTIEKLINEMGELEKKQAQGASQSSKAIAGIMGIVVATEYSTQAQKDRANEWNKIAVAVRDDAIQTGAAIGQMTKSGFTKDEIQKASVFFNEFNEGKVKANEAAQSIKFVAQQTGLYGDKLDETAKKIADQTLITKGLDSDYRSLSSQIDTNIQWLLQQDGALNTSAEQQKNIANATDAWNSKTITATELAKILKANLPIESSLLTGFDNLAIKTDKAKKELNTANQELKQIQVNGPKAKQGFSDAAQGAKDAKDEVTSLNEKLKDFNKSLSDKEFDANFKKMALERTKFSEKEIQAVMEVTQELRKKGVALDSDAAKKLYADAVRITKIEEQGNKIIDARNEAEKKNTKEKEKQQKVLQASAKVQANAAKYNFAGLESKYNLPSGMLTVLHAIETGNTGKTGQVSPAGAKGGFQFMPDTAKRFNVNPMDMQQSTEGAAKYISDLLELFKGDLEKSVRAYHAGEGNVQRGTGMGKYNNDYWEKFKGYSAGVGGYKSGDVSSKDFEKMLEDATKIAQEQADARKNLELEVANEVTKIRENLKDKLIEIDKAGFSPERTKELKDEYQARAENEIAIAEYALKTKLEDYKSFEKSESELLKASFDEKKFYAARDIELSKEQRVQAVELLDKQYKQESAYLELGRQQRIFQAEQEHMGDIERITEKYRLERAEILKTVNEEERRRKLAALGKSQDKEYEEKRRQAWDAFRTGQAERNGTGEFLQLDFAKEGATKAVEDARKYELITEKQQKAELLKIEEDYEKAKLNLKLSYGEQIAGSVASMFKQQGEEQNKYYKAAFTIEKSFAIARSMLAIQAGIAQAANNPWPLNLAAMATVAAQTASIISNIQSIHTEGFKDGGYTGNYGTSQVAGVVHGKEFVVNAEGTRRNRAALEAMNSGATLSGGGGMVQPIINVYTLEGETADVTTNADGSLDIRIRKVAGDYLRNELSSQNSQTSKAIKQNFNVTAKR